MSPKVWIIVLAALIAGIFPSAGCGLLFPDPPDGLGQGFLSGEDGGANQDAGWSRDWIHINTDIFSPRDSGSGEEWDGYIRDVAYPEDRLADIETPLVWECEIPMEELSDTIEVNSFTRRNQLAEENRLYMSYSTCASEKPFNGPEKVYFFHVDEVASLALLLNCQTPCFASVWKEGCQYANLETCWNFQKESEGTLDLSPGLYAVAVEEVDSGDQGLQPGLDWVAPPFDIHLAINRTRGLESCTPDLGVSLSDLKQQAVCLDGKLKWVLERTLPEVGAGIDRVWLPCESGSIMADPIGGMPEFIMEIHTAEGQPIQTLNAEVTLSPNLEEAAWRGILGVGGPVCGATRQLSDCDGSKSRVLTVNDVALLPGESVFIYVDGVGAEALGPTRERKFKLELDLGIECRENPAQ